MSIFSRKPRAKNTWDKTVVVISEGGKGGSSKSLVATIMAREFAKHYNTAALDADLRGPNLVRTLGGRDGHVDFDSDRRMMADTISERLHVFSSSLLFNRRYGIGWTSKYEQDFIESSLFDVNWGFPEGVDVLCVDMEPSGIDPLVILSKAFAGRIWAVMVSTPREVSVENCERALLVCIKYNIPILGIVAGMVASECPKCHDDVLCAKCGTHYNPYGGSAEVVRLADQHGVPFIGDIRFNPDIARQMDAGAAITSTDAEAVAKRVVALVEAKYKMKKRC